MAVTRLSLLSVVDLTGVATPLLSTAGGTPPFMWLFSYSPSLALNCHNNIIYCVMKLYTKRLTINKID